jgi:two-component system chemotaxis response regulator CheB
VSVERPQRTGARSVWAPSAGTPVVGIAASAGGPAALAAILPLLADLPAPVLIVQHLHPRFVDEFVEWMARVSAVPVVRAEDGVRLGPGTVYLALPGLHLRLGPGRTAVLDAAPPSLHVPSANELFLSMARHAGTAGVGVVLTGIGNDGAEGLWALREAGGTTLVQDRRSSAVHGMPSAAERRGAADLLLPLSRIGSALQSAVRARIP